LLIGLALSGVAACGKVQASTPAPPMALNVPAAPAIVVVPVTLVDPEPPPAPPPAPPAATPPATQRPANTAAARPADKPDPPPASPAAAHDTPVLQTTTDAPSTAERTRELLTEAQNNLSRVRQQDLGVQAREQYATVLGYIRTAQQALQLKNYLYAQQLATKAATLARELVKG
jgi:hypothetical protein